MPLCDGLGVDCNAHSGPILSTTGWQEESCESQGSGLVRAEDNAPGPRTVSVVLRRRSWVEPFRGGTNCTGDDPAGVPAPGCSAQLCHRASAMVYLPLAGALDPAALRGLTSPDLPAWVLPCQ